MKNRDKLLRDWIKQARRRPFEWGKHDCCLAVADYIESVTGIDYADEFRGEYSTSLGAYKMVNGRFGGSLMDCIGSHLGIGIHPLMAQRGDVGIIICDGREICAVRDLDCWWVTATNGVIPLMAQHTTALKAWRIE